jgi:UDP-N-acetylglucosamine 2-epimerase (non-hydrolysing)
LQEVNLEKSKYFLASIHRQENVDDFQNLKKILDNLEKLSETFQLPIVFSVHPRTQKRLTSGKISLPDDKFILHNPFGFFDYIKLQQNAFCVLSDSGSVSEESAILRFPAVTLRKSMERQEALAAGSILMSSLEIGELIESVKKITHSQGEPPEEYTVSNASAAVLELVLSTVSTFESWSGVRKLHV